MDWEKGARGGHFLALPGLPKPTREGKRRWVGMNSPGAALGAPGGRCLYETLCTFSLYVLPCLCLFPSHCQCSGEGTEDRGSGSPATAGRSPPDQCEPISLSSLHTANLSSYSLATRSPFCPYHDACPASAAAPVLVRGRAAIVPSVSQPSAQTMPGQMNGEGWESWGL